MSKVETAVCSLEQEVDGAAREEDEEEDLLKEPQDEVKLSWPVLHRLVQSGTAGLDIFALVVVETISLDEVLHAEKCASVRFGCLYK